MEVGERLVVLLTGEHVSLDDLAELGDEELARLYVTRGVGLRHGKRVDEKLARQIPEVTIEGDK